jgi:hypothetical protein
MSSWRRCSDRSARPPRFSTGCTDRCGNVDYSTSANCDVFASETPCTGSGQAVGFFLRRARRGSRTKHYRVVVRGGSQGPKRKVSRRCGRNRDRLGDFFWSNALSIVRGVLLWAVCCARPPPPRLRSPRCPIRRARRASTRESAPSYGRPVSGCSSTSALPRSERAARRRSSSPSSRLPPSGSSSASAAKTCRRGASD